MKSITFEQFEELCKNEYTCILDGGVAYLSEYSAYEEEEDGEEDGIKAYDEHTFEVVFKASKNKTIEYSDKTLFLICEENKKHKLILLTEKPVNIL